MAEPRIAEDELDQEVARLKSEIANLKTALSERAGDIVQGASRAAEVVTQPIRNNPGTAGLLLGGMVGMLVGLMIGHATSQQPQRHWYDRYR